MTKRKESFVTAALGGHLLSMLVSRRLTVFRERQETEESQALYHGALKEGQ